MWILDSEGDFLEGELVFWMTAPMLEANADWFV